MDINIFSNKKQIQALQEVHEKQIQEIRDENKKHLQALEKKSLKIQNALTKDILSLTEQLTTYRGNTYNSYESAVTELNNKYIGTADWGVLQTGIIINLRSVFIMGEGVKVVHATKRKAQAQKELDWCKAFFEWNDFDTEGLPILAREAELDGKIAIKIVYEEEEDYKDKYPGMISARFISWYAKKYEVKADDNDYLYYKQLKWNAGTNYKAETLNENQFIYKKFGGRINQPNDAYPTVGKCLTQIEAIDKGLRDWREINHLFAAPTPDLEVPEADENIIKSLYDIYKDKNWKIGKLLIHWGKFSMVSPPIGGVDSLKNEIETNAKFVSGTTGIPVHFLGLLDLLKSKATGESVREVMNAATTTERMIWEGAIKELITKSMLMYNSKVYDKKSKQAQLNPDNIRVEIPVITEENWNRIEKVLIPAAIAGIVTKEYVASQIPGLDTEEEEKRKQEKDDSEMEKLKTTVDNLRNNNINNNIMNQGIEGIDNIQ